MALSYIGYHGAAATSVATTNAVGDLLLCCAFRSGSATPPTLPAGWTEPITAPANGGGGTNNSCRIAWRFATSTNQGSSTWTNATAVQVVVMRGADVTTPIAAVAEDSANATSTQINYPAVANAGTGSWFVGFGMRNTAGAIAAVATAPTGMTNRGSVPATPYCSAHTLGPSVLDWPLTSVTTGGTAVKPIGVVLRIAPAIIPAVLSGQTVNSIDNDGGTPQVTTDTGEGTLYMVVVPDGDSPSAAQVKAGQNSSGGAALAAQDWPVSNAGVFSFTAVNGLASGTAYDVWFVQNNGADSNLVKADFTTTTSEITGDASVSFPLQASATAAADVQAESAVALDLQVTAASAVDVAAESAVAFALAIQAEAQQTAADIEADAAVSFPFAASGEAVVEVSGDATVPFALDVDGEAVAEITGSGSVPLPLGVSAEALVALAASALVEMGLTLAGDGFTSLEGAGSVILPLNVSAEGAVDIQGAATVPLVLVVEGTGGTPSEIANAAVAFPLQITAEGSVAIVGEAGVTLPLVVEGEGVVSPLDLFADAEISLPFNVEADGQVDITGSALASFLLTITSDALNDNALPPPQLLVLRVRDKSLQRYRIVSHGRDRFVLQRVGGPSFVVSPL